MHNTDAKYEIFVFFFQNFYAQKLNRIIKLDMVGDVDIESWKELIFTLTDLN
jgi:hypothetical protein